MKMSRLRLIGFVLAALAVAGCAPKEQFDASGEVVSGMKGLSATVQLDKPAPDFEIEDQFGKVWKLSDYRGKVVLIDYWAYWCGTCVEELGELREWNKELTGDDFAMLGMNADTGDSVAHIAEGIKRSKLTWRQGILREDSAVWKDYEVRVFPQKIVVDKDGVVRYLDNFISKEQLKKLIEKYR